MIAPQTTVRIETLPVINATTMAASNDDSLSKKDINPPLALLIKKDNAITMIAITQANVRSPLKIVHKD